jgi:DNA-directed RNA polymerase subunit RPC12/RpoP
MYIGSTYSFMDKEKPKNKCSTCGMKKQSMMGKPIYYCQKCRLYRVCMNCWKKVELKMMENDSGTNEFQVHRRKTKEKYSRFTR